MSICWCRDHLDTSLKDHTLIGLGLLSLFGYFTDRTSTASHAEEEHEVE